MFHKTKASPAITRTATLNEHAFFEASPVNGGGDEDGPGAPGPDGSLGEPVPEEPGPTP